MSTLIGSLAAGPGYYRDAAVRGNLFQRQYQMQKSNGAPVDLTGYQVRWRGVYGDVVLEKSTEDEAHGLIMNTPSSGTVLLALKPSETRLIPNDENMKYELEVYHTAGSGATQQTVLWGDLVGKGGVSRD